MSTCYNIALPIATVSDYRILFADDDEDDCLLFKDALAELSVVAELNFVHNGDKLMQFLNNSKVLPDIIFLDLNMPRKNGLACLIEIKETSRLANIPVIIYSTSFQKNVVDLLYAHGAQFYIRKPNEFSELKNVISETLTTLVELNYRQPSEAGFVLSHAIL